MEYLESFDNATFQDVVDEWLKSNANYHNKYWLGAWNSFALSIRVVVWMQQIALRGAQLDPSLVERMCESLRIQVRFLERNLEVDIRGNHLIKNIKALLWAGRFFMGADARRLQKRGFELLAMELREQVLADGMHYEKSPAYHAQVFADLLDCLAVVPDGQLRAELLAKLDMMALALKRVTHPDGGFSLFNDGALDMAYPSSVLLDAYRSDMPLRSGAFALEAAGYYGLRSARAYFLFDAGTIGPDFLPAHGQGDIFSFEWTLDGHRIIVDPGVFEYEEGEMRAYSRSTRAHNTVTLDNLDQAEFWKSFRVGRRPRVLVHSHQGGETLSVDGEHDGYAHLAGGPMHRRTVTVSECSISVVDQVIGGAGQVATARLLLHPECTVRRVVGGAEIRRGALHVALETSAPVTIDTALFCPNFGTSLEAPRVTMRLGEAPTSGSFNLRLVSGHRA